MPSSGSCRFCPNIGETVSLFDRAHFTEGVSLADAVYDFATVRMTPDDARPQSVCIQQCLVRLEDCYRFRQQIRNAENIAQRMIQKNGEVAMEADECNVPEEEYEMEFLIYDEEDRIETKVEITEPQVAETIDTIQNHFLMPLKTQLLTHLEFENFDYIEFRGERCCGCNHVFDDAKELQAHSYEFHASVSIVPTTGYVCSVCKKCFQNASDLQKHKNYFATKELFVCKLCRQEYHGKEALMTHMEDSPFHRKVMEQSEEDVSETENITLDDREENDLVEPPAAQGEDIEIECGVLENAETKSPKQRSLKLPDQHLISSIDEHDQYQIIHVDSAERCCGCGLYFETYEQMLEHARQEHQQNKFPDTNKPFCEICYESFKASWALNAHRTHCRYVKQLFFCKPCLIIYARKFQLTKHFQSTPGHVLDAEMTASITQTSTEDQTKTTGPHRIGTGFACCFLKCSSMFETEKQLHTHVDEQHAPRRQINSSERSSEKHVCPICLRCFGSHQLMLLHRNRSLRKKHICSYCGEGFLIPSKLREHEQLVHSGNVPQHPCDICAKAFRTVNLLKVHRLTHNQEREFSCDQCGAQFRFRFQLKKHTSGVHPTSFPYACKFCEKKFSTKAKYDLHTRSHTGEKPYTCRFQSCGKQFSHVTDRKRHEMGVHTGERPHRCTAQHCSAAYIRKRELLIHMQKHQNLRE